MKLEAIDKKEQLLLGQVDAMFHPSNEDLNPLVTYLLENRFADLKDHPEAGRLTRGAIRLRMRSLLATSGDRNAELKLRSLDSWLTMQGSRYTNN